MLNYVKDRAVDQIGSTVKPVLGTVTEGAEIVIDKAKHLIQDEASTLKDKAGDIVNQGTTRLTQSGSKGDSNIGKAIETSQDIARKTLEKAEDLYYAGKE